MINAITNVPLTTPVLFLIFNRPSTTKLVFEQIRKARPTKLYLAADGPRESRPDDIAKCAEARTIAMAVDWPCEVKSLFREKNLGCGEGPSTAITWFFTHEEEGIILEDDCLPSASFFTFTAELLARYRNDARVMMIGGNSFESQQDRDQDYSYSFSNHISIWGWATWRRAWKHHNFKMDHFQEINRKNYLDYHYNTLVERDYFNYIFGKMFKGDDRTNRKTIWDYQWQFACTIHSGLIIIPNRNLIQNLGFGNDATNTRKVDGVGHDLPSEEIDFPLKHPEFMIADSVRDNRYFRKVNSTALSRLKSNIKNIIPKPMRERILRPITYFFL